MYNYNDIFVKYNKVKCFIIKLCCRFHFPLLSHFSTAANLDAPYMSTVLNYTVNKSNKITGTDRNRTESF